MYLCKRVRELFVIFLVIESSLCDVNEPRCYSWFDYEEKMLGKIVKTDSKMEEILESKLQAPVAFFARVSSAFTSSISQTLVFEDVFTDVGGGCNPGTGVFNAPVDSLYVFSITVMVQMSSSAATALFVLKKNDDAVMWLYVNENDIVTEAASGTGLLPLKVGDTVRVTSDPSGGHIYGSYTFFSGFKL
ncbi:collagen alpha-2(VIII) chain-like [Mya arenaria]|uniref:collagen alpha-2(VIII) chain-like n=1 Tax=Mya arenaria TaxID=6604 RepID=UPI0022E5F8BB|nr:collagen alpha-2(VIII) chain-like [Mya arenaria]